MLYPPGFGFEEPAQCRSYTEGREKTVTDAKQVPVPYRAVERRAYAPAPLLMRASVCGD
jgi:hypothetical protein